MDISPQVVAIVAGALIAIIVIIGMVYVGLREQGGEDPLEKRLAELSERDETPVSLEELELSLSFQERVVVPAFENLAKMVLRFTPEAQLEATRQLLRQAGPTNKMTPETFWGQRIALTVALGVGMFIVMGIVAKQEALNVLLFTAGGAVLGFMLPQLQVKSQIERRQTSIQKALPDALDLLTICVEAGLGFEGAMAKVYEKWDNDLALAFGRVLQEIQLGKLRREALRDMAESMNVNDVTTFVAAVVQAEQLGVSMAKILRIQSDQMRVKRRQRAQEKAQQAPVKMVIPLVILIFPSIYIVLMGPAILQVMDIGVMGMV
ncbi:MAG: type II secretion system F family protein [Anaerolineae bacterium]|nr:type II secretion system F family protein [Anaerolineae bacterium]